jgi:hypothetical protein
MGNVVDGAHHMSIRFLLLAAALVFTVFVIIIGFGWWDDQAAHVWGWFGLSFVCLILAWFPFADQPARRP